jgi:hypothetical protein
VRAAARLAALVCSGAAGAGVGAERYTGACDGSAIVAAGGSHFWSASDEDNRIRLYRRGSPGLVREFDLNGFLQPERNKRGLLKEVDLEGVARIGNRLYWIGSHGRDSGGDVEASRHRLFATDVRGFGLRPAGRPFAGLVDGLKAEDSPVGEALRGAEPLAPEKGGISIEGLAAGPGRSLLIGFRSPLVSGRAIVARLVNPGEVVAEGAKPKFGEAALLDLGGLGVRALENGGRGGALWILAGPSRSGGEFRLYGWRAGDAKAVEVGPDLPKGEGSPEGLMYDAGRRRLFVSLDAGDQGDPPCKGRAERERSFGVYPVRTR